MLLFVVAQATRPCVILLHDGHFLWCRVVVSAVVTYLWGGWTEGLMDGGSEGMDEWTGGKKMDG